MKTFCFVTPAKAGAHPFAAAKADQWVPAFPTDQVRGLKAHGTTHFFLRVLGALVVKLPDHCSTCLKAWAAITAHKALPCDDRWTPLSCCSYHGVGQLVVLVK